MTSDFREKERVFSSICSIILVQMASVLRPSSPFLRGSARLTTRY
jgi:hypothetical protein